MKHLLIIFSLLLTSVSWSKDIDIFTDLKKVEGLYYEKFSDVPFTGNSISSWKGKIKNGIRVGKWVNYTFDGQLMSIENLDYKGRRHGEFKEYNFDGQLIRVENYKKGRLHGKVERYDSLGLINFYGYYKNGQMHGDFYSYNKSLNEKTYTRYKNDRVHGEFKRYKNNILEFHYIFKNGISDKTIYESTK